MSFIKKKNHTTKITKSYKGKSRITKYSEMSVWLKYVKLTKSKRGQLKTVTVKPGCGSC